MTLSQHLAQLLANGLQQIGQIAILSLPDSPYTLCHLGDSLAVRAGQLNQLTPYPDPASARHIATLSPAGEFRYLKSSPNLARGWVMPLQTFEALHQALDLFYPAALGLHLAQKNDTLRIQNLRPKLQRQTGMYRWAHTLSDAGCQTLIQDICDPANCLKKILWQIDENQALHDSPAAQKSGQLHPPALPLLCQEPCNHLVAEARTAAKKEADATKA